MAKTFIKLLALIMMAVMMSSTVSCVIGGTTTLPDDGPDNTTSTTVKTDVDDPNYTPVLDPVDDNYRTFYQIFVYSFSDGNNDGVGDLQGVINRLDYLNDGDINSGNDLGVQGIWLSPVFSAPSYHKYDAKDYYSIDWRYGTEEKLKELVDLCHERNVMVILDLAINHTSNQHPWFLAFKEARLNGDTDSKYYNFYSCAKTVDKKNGLSYQKISGIDCWYECNFTSDMPELNYDNPDVREAMVDVAKYYLAMGIDGFRFDAIKYIYYGDTQKSAKFWEWYMNELRKEYPDMYAVGECWSGDSEVIQYYGSMNCFNFTMSGAEGKVASTAKGIGNISQYTNYVVSYQSSIKSKNPNAMMSAFLSNHDQDRIAGTFVSDNNMKMAANLYLLTHGSPVIYYGEEIGLRGSRGTEMTDANRRLSMRWGDYDLIRDPIGSTYPSDKQIKSTVASQLEDPNSMLMHYSKLLSIRHKYPAIARGTYSALTYNKNLGGFLVSYQGEKLAIIHNTSSSPITVNLSSLSGLNGYQLKQLCDYVGAGNATLNGTTLTIGAYTSVILK